MSKKILITLLLVITICLLCSTNSFAANYPFEFCFTDLKIDYPIEIINLNITNYTTDLSSYKYYTLYDTGTVYWFFVSDTEPYIYSYMGEWYRIYEFTVEGNSVEFIYEYGNSNKSKGWQANKKNIGSSSSTIIGKGFNPNYSSRWIYSNYDIKHNDVVFHEAYKSPDSPLVQSVKSVNSMDLVTYEIFSIFPIVIVVMISFISIRKVINFIKINTQNA